MPISVSVLVLAADAVANFIFMIPVFSKEKWTHMTIGYHLVMICVYFCTNFYKEASDYD